MRDILSYHGHSQLISFAGGLPGLASLPLEKIKKAAGSVFADYGSRSLQYGTSEGYPPLREWIASELTGDGVATEADEIIITTGSQQALDIISRTFLNPGDGVCVEVPTYNGALQAFDLNEALLHDMKSDEEGPLKESMKSVLQDISVKLCYLTPTIQNPSGKSYSLQRRNELANVLDESNCWFIEDDPYSRLIFDGSTRPMISSLMKTQSIVVGSFSKTVSPSLRVGYLRAPRNVIERIIPVKQAMDLHTTLLSQMILYRFLLENSFEEHLYNLREEYAAKQSIMIQALDESQLPVVLKCRPEGGMFLWLEFEEGLDTVRLSHIALKEGVAFVPGSAFYYDARGSRFGRLNYTAVNGDEIFEGVRRLSRAVKEFYKTGDSQ